MRIYPIHIFGVIGARLVSLFIWCRLPRPPHAPWFRLLLSCRSQVLQSGKCGCLDFDLTQGDDYILIMESMVFVSSYVDGYSDDVQRQIIATLCNGVANDGDHLQVKENALCLHCMSYV